MSITQASDRNALLNAVKAEMEKSITAFKADLQKVRTGRASASILDDVQVDSYGAKMKIAKVANITTPEARLIMVNPFDKSMLPVIEKAIQISGLGLTPMNDGKIIRISIPPLSEERRKDIVKQAKQKAEDARVSIRTHRQDGITQSKNAQTKFSWSKDEVFRAGEEIQKLTDTYNKEIDKIFAAKEKEILTV